MMAVVVIGHGQIIKSEVLYGIVSQSIRIDLAIVSGDQPVLKRLREVGINNNRRTAQKHYSGSDEFVLLLDSDVVITDRYAVEKAYNMLVSRPDLIAVLIDTKGGYDTHNYCSCAVIRNSAWQKIEYMKDPMKCQCIKVSEIGPVEYIFGNYAHEIAR